ncbi:hypothetical protein BU16DRAFT_333615 [Lophium mytilinum]|uniref:Uncharacterized protein n=1 Tax=Lophium mytilinum TaxID=390894 RepID=A0A6A6R3U5_9PEZI|nr:hypothetical protein BU16DRAFT_333615 [Lophium mytilinum]
MTPTLHHNFCLNPYHLLATVTMAKLRKGLNPFSSSSSDSPDKHTHKKSRSRSSSPASTNTTPTQTPTKDKPRFSLSEALSDALCDALRPPSRGKPEASPTKLQPPPSDARPRSRGKDKETTASSSRSKSLDLGYPPRSSSSSISSSSSPITPPSRSPATRSPASKFFENTDAATATADWATQRQTDIDNALLAPAPLFSSSTDQKQYAFDLSPVKASPAPTLAQTLTTSPTPPSSSSFRAAPSTSLLTRVENVSAVKFPRPHGHGQLVRGGIIVTAWKRWQCCKCGAQTVWEQEVCSNLACVGEKCGWCGGFED